MKKFILILAPARSGSTALMNIVGSLPKSEIKGESWGGLILIIRSYQRLLHNIQTKNGKPNTGFQHLTLDEMRFKTRHLILNTWMNVNPANYDYLGFKEVRFGDFPSSAELMKWMLAVRDLFEDRLHFILYLREPADILASMNQRPNWWLKKPSLGAIQEESNRLQRAFDMVAQSGCSTSVVNQTQWSKDPSLLLRVFEDLGEKVPEQFLDRYYQMLRH